MACDWNLAAGLHAAAIHLLRRLRVADRETGLSAPRLSALSVLVFGGPQTVTELAEAEQVQIPTISRLIRELEAEGLVRREADAEDRRVQRIAATSAGRTLLEAGRRRRVETLVADIEALSEAERAQLHACLPILQRLAQPGGGPFGDGPATDESNAEDPGT